MRKLTGYIGAMIIVFALMGSVLMGYALNVNGTNTIVNEYEKVTDVSGLYDHSEEKSYIDYNPASNYTNYNEDTAGTILYSQVGSLKYKKIVEDCNITISGTTGEIWINGSYTGHINVSSTISYLNDYFMVVKNVSYVYILGYNSNYETVQSEIYITISGTTTTLSYNAHTYTYTNVKNNLAWYSINDNFDYYMIGHRAPDAPNAFVLGYINSTDQLVTVSTISPSLSETIDTTTSSTIITSGRNYSSYGYSGTLTTSQFMFDDLVSVPGGAYALNVNYDDKTSSGWGGYSKTISGSSIYYPRTAVLTSSDDLGINYTRSNRVNNYPVEYDYNQYTTTQTETVNLMALSAANQFTYNDGWYIGMGLNSADNGNGYYAFAGYFKIKYGVYEYKLSDILSTLTIPAGTTTINIDTGQLNLAVASTIVSVPTSIVSQGYLPVNSSVPYNTELTTIFPNSNQYAGQVTTDYQFNYGIYYPDTGLIDIFDKRNNVKLWTASANDAVIRFVDSSVTVGDYDYNYHGYVNDNYVSGTNGTGFNLGVRGTPQLNLTYTINGAITNTYYMDITKGVSIKSSNTSPVIWNNQYENGVIDLLFRAESTTDIYHNEFTVSNNTVSVDFDGGRYSVTLNGADPVDIGTWRNIIISIDLINGKLYAIPVKTFNSYTNVVLTNTSVTIGDLVSAQPTNTISWATTNKSFTFNVYSTKVFMDTYGLIMVNPSLNITDYFTDLNQFYRLDMYNFATYGDSMTINGETLPVNNGLVTYGNKSLELRDFSVTYADGKVSIGDNHTSIEMGNIATTDISMTGAWYFLTDLERGYTTQKVIYDWDWGTFIFDNTEFAVFYLGFMAAALIVARRFCSITITDYAVIIVSIIIALGVQVIA